MDSPTAITNDCDSTVPSVLYVSRQRLGLASGPINSTLPAQFISYVDGDMSLGVSMMGGLEAPSGETVTVNDNFVVVSWADATDQAELLGVASLTNRFYLACALSTLFTALIAASWVIDPSQVDPQPLEHGFPESYEYSSSQTHAHNSSFVVITVLLNAFGFAAAFDRSPTTLTFFCVFVALHFLVAAPRVPSFLFVLQFVAELASAFAALSLRRKLVVSWVTSGTLQQRH